MQWPIPGPGEHPYKGAAISEVLLGTEATRAACIFAIAGVECCTFEGTVPSPYEHPQLWDASHGCVIADWLQATSAAS
jgi:hypothetical protein